MLFSLNSSFSFTYYSIKFHIYYRYPEDKITILTTYNGQKALIRDVLNQRCSWNPLFGRPAKVTTVDKFQGQQNDCKYNKILDNVLFKLDSFCNIVVNHSIPYT